MSTWISFERKFPELNTNTIRKVMYGKGAPCVFTFIKSKYRVF